MPLFSLLVQGLFGALATFLGRMFSFRIAVRIAAVAAIVALGTALMAAFNLAVTPLASALFSSTYGQLVGLAFPPIAGTCLATITALWLAVTTYRLQVQAIKITAGI